MAAIENQLNFQQSHYQKQSPLFGGIPGEIRNKIFVYSLVQYEDDGAAYPENSYWYRPGFKGPKKSSSSLLRTCKLAYLEGQKVYLHELEWAFWFNRGPSGRSGDAACTNFFRNLSPAQARDLQQVRFFTQMFWLEGGRGLTRIFNNANFRPSRLTITIRYTDWWWWESNEKLTMSVEWLRNFNGPPGLRELRVEYETLAWKKAQMDRIVERNRKWRLQIRDSGHLSTERSELETWAWTGPSKLDGQTWDHHVGDTIEYVVVTDTWRFVDGDIPEDVLQSQNAYEVEHSKSESDDADGWEDEDMSEEQDDDEDDDEADTSAEDDSELEEEGGGTDAGGHEGSHLG